MKSGKVPEVIPLETEKVTAHEAGFTPALGRPGLTRLYDLAIRLLTREQHWRAELLRRVAPKGGETILDIGCGTGTFAILLKQATPGARVIGLDSDPNLLRIAAAKAKKAGAAIEWRQGFSHDAAAFDRSEHKAVSSLVFHQVPLAGKRKGVAAMFQAVRNRGEVHIANYARQPGALMRMLFRLTVQLADGTADTQPNADGALEAILADLMGKEVQAEAVVRTATGAISLFRALAPATPAYPRTQAASNIVITGS